MKKLIVLVIISLIVTIEIVQLIIFGHIDTRWLILPALIIGSEAGFLVAAKVFEVTLVQSNMIMNDKLRIVPNDKSSKSP